MEFLFGKRMTAQDALQRNVDKLDAMAKALKRDRDRLMFDFELVSREADACSAAKQPVQKRMKLREQITLQRNIDLMSRELDRVQVQLLHLQPVPRSHLAPPPRASASASSQPALM